MKCSYRTLLNAFQRCLGHALILDRRLEHKTTLLYGSKKKLSSNCFENKAQSRTRSGTSSKSATSKVSSISNRPENYFDLDHKGSTSAQFIEAAYKSIVHSDDDIIALNKPVGVSVHGSRSPSQAGSSAVIDSLSELSRRLQTPDLEIGLSLKSFYSGLILICKGSKSKGKLDLALKFAASQKLQVLSYLVISVGIPTCPLGTDLSTYIRREFLHNREMSVIQEQNNNTARKSGSMMLASFRVQTLSTNEDLGVSLVEVSINKDKWESVETILSHWLSPVLGDNIYSSRAQYLMGVPFRTSAHTVPPTQQRLPARLQAALEDYDPGLTETSRSMPLCMHRHKISLSRFPRKDSVPLILTAPLPLHFVSLLKHLGLNTKYVH
ncbi:RNA pseudouridylate synthase domain-containing [Plakobranchus ocellatus]|uniref:RNA pseudouridylate synthase domain-containing n=1 Tax=Plakobranchus ocellatus TaxID=259542 RepID=A0AAV4AJG0_9GAST|nr:RNA pseudouridylate synthase domain-containing [Plakobranchus ocellatus]